MPAKKTPCYVPQSKAKRYWYGHRFQWAEVKRIPEGQCLATKPFQLLCSHVRTRCQIQFFPKGLEQEQMDPAVKFSILESDLDSIYLAISVFLHTTAGPLDLSGDKLQEQTDPALTTLYPHDNGTNHIIIRARENLDQDKYARNKILKIDSSSGREYILLIALIWVKKTSEHLQATLRHNVDAVSRRWDDGVYKNLYENVRQLNTDDVPFPLPEMLDVELRCQDNVSFLLHRIVLAERSPVWNRMFSDDFKEKNSRVTFDNHKGNVLSVFIRALYTGHLDSQDLLDEELIDLADLADYYQVEKLKAEVENFLVSRVDSSNAFDFLKFADSHNCLQLKGRCITQVCHAKTEIFRQNISDTNNHMLLLEILQYDDEANAVKEQLTTASM